MRRIFTTVHVGARSGPRSSGKEHVPASGPVILAPVHRSFADFGFAAFCTRRKLFFMTKDEHVGEPVAGPAAPLRRAPSRSIASRPTVRRCSGPRRSCSEGECLVLFPEGTRRQGPVIEDLMEGAAFLSARTGAPIVPIGIGGSDLAMPKGKIMPKPLTIQVVIGPAIPPPPRTGGGRVSRSAVHAATDDLVAKLQAVYDEARAKTGRY